MSHGISTNLSSLPYPTVDGNQVHGGTAPTSYGWRFVAGAVTGTKNSIHGGTGSSISYGVYSSFVDLNIYNNLIHGGESSTSSNGVFIVGSSATVRNNTVYTGGAGAAIKRGIVLSTNATSVVAENNNVFGDGSAGSECIYLGTSDSNLDNNNLFNCNHSMTAIFGACAGNGDGDGNAATCNLADVNGLAWASGNVEVDPQFTDIDGVDNDINTLADNDWTIASGAGVDLRQGGLDGNAAGWGFNVDYLDAARTPNTSGSPSNTGAAGWSMGAYKQD